MENLTPYGPAFHRRFPNAAPLSHPDAPLSLNAGDRFVFVHPSWVTEVMGHNRHRINAKVPKLPLDRALILACATSRMLRLYFC